MNEQNDHEEREPVVHERAERPNRKPLYVAAAAAGLLVFAILIIMIWQRDNTGEVVPAPRSVTFDQGTGNDAVSSGEQTITIPADQLEHAGIKVETVGETLSTEA